MDLPPRQALPRFAQAFVLTMQNPTAIAMAKLVLSESARRPAVADMVNAIGPGRIIPLLRRYMAHQMDVGTLRRMDPGAAVRCFLGPLLAYLLTREVFKQPDLRIASPPKRWPQPPSISSSMACCRPSPLRLRKT